MKWFFELIDLSTNLDRGLGVVRNLYGLSALVMGIALLGISVGLAPLVWFLDIDSTLDYAAPALNQVLPTLPSWALPYSVLMVFALTMLPTLIELFTAKFAMQIKGAAFLVYGFAILDAVTDYPRVKMLMDAYKVYFDGLGMLGKPLWWLMHPIGLLLASFVFEVLVVVFSICAFVCFVQSQYRVARGR
jgi:hypothetical protein